MKVNIKGIIVSNDNAWVYNFFGMSCFTPEDIHKAISQNPSDEPLDVYINSDGGEIFAASEIYAALREYGNVNIHVTGLAASAASVIMCAGKSDISPTSMVMIHNVSSSASGDYRDMAHKSTALKSASQAIAQAYCDKSGMSMDDIQKMMDKETYLTAQQAVEYGLIDKIAEYKDQTSPMPSSLVATCGNVIPHEIIQQLQNKRMKAQTELELIKLKGDIKL